MYAHQLIGKLALRTRHAALTGGGIDRSYMDTPVRILAATEFHLVVETRHTPNHILAREWNDDKWTSFDELIALASPEHIALMQITGNLKH